MTVSTRVCWSMISLIHVPYALLTNVTVDDAFPTTSIAVSSFCSIFDGSEAAALYREGRAETSIVSPRHGSNLRFAEYQCNRSVRTFATLEISTSTSHPISLCRKAERTLSVVSRKACLVGSDGFISREVSRRGSRPAMDGQEILAMRIAETVAIVSLSIKTIQRALECILSAHLAERR